MKIGMLGAVAWPTPPGGFGPWESVVSNITEGLVARGHDVTLFATKTSKTSGKLHAICPIGYEEDPRANGDVWLTMHVAEAYEHAGEFDMIHNHCDYRGLVFTRLVDTPVLTTIHGFSSPALYPAYEKYNADSWYVSISDADRYEKLDYVSTVYNSINLEEFTFAESRGDDLLFIGRIHYEKGVAEAIEIARRTDRRLTIAGPVQQEDYFHEKVEPHIDGEKVRYVGSVDAPERDALMGQAAAVLCPVMRPERFGLVLAESMACGTPVIAFDRGSPRELIRQGETGFVVDDVDGAVEAVARLGDIDPRVCRRHVERSFSVERQVEGYLSAYERVLEEHRQGGKRTRRDRDSWEVRVPEE